MSRRWWGGGAVTALGLLLSVVLLPDWLRTYLAILFMIALIVCVVGFFLAENPKHGRDKSVNISGQGMSGNVVAAGRDAIQSVHHYHHPPPLEPFGMRVDTSALRDFKNHRDNGEKILQSIRPGDGSSGAEWGKIDNWWIEAITKANQNVFSPFLTLRDLTRFREPLPDDDELIGLSLKALSNAVDEGQINHRDEEDVKLYVCHWERLERLRQLIGIIESKG